jgi:hypothetical protein
MIMSRKARLDENVACMAARRNGFRVLVEKTEGKRPVRRTRRRWQDNIKIRVDLRETGWDGMHWIYLAQDRAHVNTAMNLRYP